MQVVHERRLVRQVERAPEAEDCLPRVSSLKRTGKDCGHVIVVVYDVPLLVQSICLHGILQEMGGNQVLHGLVDHSGGQVSVLEKVDLKETEKKQTNKF